MKKFLMFILGTVGFIVIQIISMFLAIFVKAFTDLEFTKAFLYAAQNSTQEYITLCYQLIPLMMLFNFILWAIPIFIYIKVKKIKLMKKLEWFKVFYFTLLGFSLNAVISVIVGLLPSSLLSNYSSSIGYVEEISFFPLLIAVGIFAPIVEEFVFRYILINSLKKNKILALIISSLVFGVIHGNIVQGSYAFVLGLILGYLYIKTDNLLPSIIVHVSINSSSVFATFLNPYLVYVIAFISVILTMYMTITKKDKLF